MKIFKKIILTLVTITLVMSCDLFASDDSSSAAATSGNKVIQIGGSIYNGVTLTDLDVPAYVFVTYGNVRQQANVRIIKESTTNIASAWWSATIPENTAYVVEVKADGYVDFTATDTIKFTDTLEDNKTTADGVIDVDSKTTVQKDICLYPETAIEYDLNYRLVAANVTATADAPATGYFTAKVTPIVMVADAGRIIDFEKYYTNNTITGTITDGRFTIPKAELMYGAAYTVTIHGVDGYLDQDVTVSAVNLTSQKDLSLVEMVSSDHVEDALSVVATNYIDTEGTTLTELTSVSFTFNKAIELHPALVENYVTLVDISNGENYNNATLVAWSNATDTVGTLTAVTDYTILNAPFGQSNRGDISISADNLTVTVTATITSLNSEQNEDDFNIDFFLDRVKYRELNTNDTWATTLSAVSIVQTNVR